MRETGRGRGDGSGGVEVPTDWSTRGKEEKEGERSAEPQLQPLMLHVFAAALVPEGMKSTKFSGLTQVR